MNHSRHYAYSQHLFLLDSPLNRAIGALQAALHRTPSVPGNLILPRRQGRRSVLDQVQFSTDVIESRADLHHVVVIGKPAHTGKKFRFYDIIIITQPCLATQNGTSA